MSNVEWVTSRSDFNDLLETEDAVVVDFTAPAWCRPCQQFAPHFDKAADNAFFQSDMLGRTKFIAVDVDNAPWAMEDFGVRGVPTVKLFVGGQEVSDLKERTVVKFLSEIRNKL